MVAADVYKYKRACVIDGAEVIGGSVDERVTHYLYAVLRSVGSLDSDCGDILVNVFSENSLYQEDVVQAVNCFENPQVIHISVAVEIKIGNGVGVIVQNIFELLYIR